MPSHSDTTGQWFPKALTSQQSCSLSPGRGHDSVLAPKPAPRPPELSPGHLIGPGVDGTLACRRAWLFISSLSSRRTGKRGPFQVKQELPGAGTQAGAEGKLVS